MVNKKIMLSNVKCNIGVDERGGNDIITATSFGWRERNYIITPTSTGRGERNYVITLTCPSCRINYATQGQGNSSLDR